MSRTEDDRDVEELGLAEEEEAVEELSIASNSSEAHAADDLAAEESEYETCEDSNDSDEGKIYAPRMATCHIVCRATAWDNQHRFLLSTTCRQSIVLLCEHVAEADSGGDYLGPVFCVRQQRKFFSAHEIVELPYICMPGLVSNIFQSFLNELICDKVIVSVRSCFPARSAQCAYSTHHMRNQSERYF
jgi:hypothetical protein